MMSRTFFLGILEDSTGIHLLSPQGRELFSSWLES